MTLEAKIRQLEERQAKAKEQQAKANALVKETTQELKKVQQQAEAKAKEEAAKKEQKEALAFYRKYGTYKAEELDLWIALIEEAKMQSISVSDKDGNEVSRLVYEWLKMCYAKRMKEGITGASR